MQNAHERFGFLEFTKHTKEISTRVRLHLERAILEPGANEDAPARAHLLSLVGGDAEVAAVCAGIADTAALRIEIPERDGLSTVTFGPDAKCFRGSLVLPGRSRPLRHLLAVSDELAASKPGADCEGSRTILCNDDPSFVLYRIACRYGLPVLPTWAQWFAGELRRKKAIQPLVGLGISPVLVKGNKPQFLRWIGQGLRKHLIRIPEDNGPLAWDIPPLFSSKF